MYVGTFKCYEHDNLKIIQLFDSDDNKRNYTINSSSCVKYSNETASLITDCHDSGIKLINRTPLWMMGAPEYFSR